MKLLLPMMLALMLAGCATSKPCCRNYAFYEAPYCDYYTCGGVTREFCHPARYAYCKADATKN